MVLDKIKKANDIKKVPQGEYELLAKEIREFLIEKISVCGGHLSSNLGVVELTMALHLVCNLPKDKIIWDVGHQSYTHKILTGRKNDFDGLRQHGGMSGFPKRSESDCDSFDTGHASTSLSAGLGFAQAGRILKQKNKVIAVIGDGALTGGMAFEALNNASDSALRANFIIVLNDNKMSISPNVGGLSQVLANWRTARSYQGLKKGVIHALNRVPVFGEGAVGKIRKMKDGVKQVLINGMFFEEMGITYLGPVDGHNVNALVKVLREASKVNGAVVVHAMTQKGKGYEPAESFPDRFHGTEAFQIETGYPACEQKQASYTEVFSKVMLRLGKGDKKIVAITAAMVDGTGLKRFSKAFPNRFFDVGIAEEHAVTFAAGLAAGGLNPVFAVYSSFLQRAYDQILHDVCLQDLHVTFAVDRAGLVGSDGETHQGIFDLSFLSSIPNMTVMAPKNAQELSDMLSFATNFGHPVALRYPRGEAYEGCAEFCAPIQYGKSEMLVDESGIALLAVGSMVKTAIQVRDRLKQKGHPCSLVNVRFVKPLDTEMLDDMALHHGLLVTMEENVQSGGFGEHVTLYLNRQDHQPRLLNISIADQYVEQGSVEILQKEVGIDADTILKKIMDVIS